MEKQTSFCDVVKSEILTFRFFWLWASRTAILNIRSILEYPKAMDKCIGFPTMESLLGAVEIPKSFWVCAQRLSRPEMAMFVEFWGISDDVIRIWSMPNWKILKWPEGHHAIGGKCKVLKQSDKKHPLEASSNFACHQNVISIGGTSEWTSKSWSTLWKGLLGLKFQGYDRKYDHISNICDSFIDFAMQWIFRNTKTRYASRTNQTFCIYHKHL